MSVCVCDEGFKLFSLFGSRNLNAENEMKRIFGSRVVRGEQRHETTRYMSIILHRHHRRKQQRQTM